MAGQAVVRSACGFYGSPCGPHPGLCRSSTMKLKGKSEPLCLGPGGGGGSGEVDSHLYFFFFFFGFRKQCRRTPGPPVPRVVHVTSLYRPLFVPFSRHPYHRTPEHLVTFPLDSSRAWRASVLELKRLGVNGLLPWVCPAPPDCSPKVRLFSGRTGAGPLKTLNALLPAHLQPLWARLAPGCFDGFLPCWDASVPGRVSWPARECNGGIISRLLIIILVSRHSSFLCSFVSSRLVLS
jgi:hypothetical protein